MSSGEPPAGGRSATWSPRCIRPDRYSISTRDIVDAAPTQGALRRLSRGRTRPDRTASPSAHRRHRPTRQPPTGCSAFTPLRAGIGADCARRPPPAARPGRPRFWRAQRPAHKRPRCVPSEAGVRRAATGCWLASPIFAGCAPLDCDRRFAGCQHPRAIIPGRHRAGCLARLAARVAAKSTSGRPVRCAPWLRPPRRPARLVAVFDRPAHR